MGATRASVKHREIVETLELEVPNPQYPSYDPSYGTSCTRQLVADSDRTRMIRRKSYPEGTAKSPVKLDRRASGDLAASIIPSPVEPGTW